MVEEALAEGKRRGDGDRKRRATAGCGFECASAVGFLSVGNVLFFFFLLFCASLPLFFASSCSSFAVQDEWAFE